MALTVVGHPGCWRWRALENAKYQTDTPIELLDPGRQRDHLGWRALAGIAVAAAVAYLVACLVRGLGIAVPGLLLAAVAFAGGALGTLPSADLLNLPRIRSLDAPVASIGGVGTFDAVFLSGIWPC